MHASLTQPTAQSSPLFKARMAGFLWLMTIITGMFSFIAGGSLIVPGNSGATAANILGHEFLYRLAFAANLVAAVCYIGVTVLVYELFKGVSRSVAFFGVLVSLIGCATGAVSGLLFLAPVYLLNGTPYLAAFTAEQLQAQAHTSATLSLFVNDIGMVFFACHVLSIGYLIRRSTFLPRFLGLFLFVTGICYLANSFANFLNLPFRSYLLPFVAIGGLLGEGSLTGWFLVKGVNSERWKEQAATAGG